MDELLLAKRYSAYQALSGLFVRKDESPLEIEILPKAFQPQNDELLREGNCIGVSRRLLISAFLYASTVALGDADGISSSHTTVGVCMCQSPLPLDDRLSLPLELTRRGV